MFPLYHSTHAKFPNGHELFILLFQLPPFDQALSIREELLPFETTLSHFSLMGPLNSLIFPLVG